MITAKPKASPKVLGEANYKGGKTSQNKPHHGKTIVLGVMSTLKLSDQLVGLQLMI